MRTKIIYLLIVFAIKTTCFIQGQDYHPLLGDSNEWFVWHTFEGTYTDYFKTTGDTLINGKNYKNFLYVLYYNISGLNKLDTLGHLREDTLSGKVYLLQGTREVVYIDFSLKENDSIFLFTINKSSTGWYHVDSIARTSILAGERKITYLRRDTLGDTEYPIWIESVGTIGHLLYPEYTPTIWRGELSCEFKNGEKVYQSEKSQNLKECIYTKIDDISEDMEITISPNPAKSIVQIKYPNIMQYKLSIFDVYGKQLLILDKPANIELNNFQPGIYLLVFKSTSQTISKKLVINK
jgi:hypothetical protein